MFKYALTECHWALGVTLDSVRAVLQTQKKYRRHATIERIVEPERLIMFRVPRMDDHGSIHVNKGYRVEFNPVLVPYYERLHD